MSEAVQKPCNQKNQHNLRASGQGLQGWNRAGKKGNMTNTSGWSSLSAMAVFILAGGLNLFLPMSASAATLTHRWPFDTNADDVIGGANSTLVGNAYISKGAVVLDGTNSGVQLPNDLFTNYDSISFEAWFVDENCDGGRLYNFSGPTGQMDCTILGSFPPGFASYPVGGTCFSVGGISNVVHTPSPTPDVTNHLVWTLDADAGCARAYMNGILVSQNPTFTNTPAEVGSTTTNWIGTAQAGSNTFNGCILEFRAYQGALTPLEVAQLDAAGPENPAPNAGLLQAIRLSVPACAGPGASLRPVVFADFENLTNVNVTGQPGLTLTAENTNVILVTAATNVLRRYDPYTVAPLLTSTPRLNTQETGTTEIAAVYQDLTNCAMITVALPEGFDLVHRYCFGEPGNARVVHDATSQKHGRLFGSGQLSGAGELLLPCGPAGNPNDPGYNPSYVSLPGGLISGQSEISVEAWVTWQGPANSYWQRIFDFGDQVLFNPWTATTYLFLTPDSGGNSILRGYAVGASITTNSVTGESTPIAGSRSVPLDVPAHPNP
jgi:Concanavalin A-like lectin/glucanases superfamily